MQTARTVHLLRARRGVLVATAAQALAVLNRYPYAFGHLSGPETREQLVEEHRTAVGVLGFGETQAEDRSDEEADRIP